jgi:DNA polymerase (family 10)
MDLDDEFLSKFDFVVASIHSGFKMTEEIATKRLCRALENPHVDILGHPSGRLLLERDGYPVNHERIIECAAKHRKAIELNADPYRLDIDWRWISKCIEAGVPVPIDPDSHSAGALENVQYGLDVAAKAGLTAADCPSAWDVNDLLSWVKRK